MHIGKTEVSPLIAVCQAGVVDTQEMQGGGVEVVNMHGILDDIVTEVVGFTEHVTAFDAGTGHPDTKATRMMVPTVIISSEISLGKDGPSELPTPDDESVFEQAAFFQFQHQSGARLIDIVALALDAAGQVVVLIPAAMIELDEAHPALCETSCENTVRGITARFARLGTIALENGLRFF